MLMALVKQSMRKPFQRLPALTAVFLAEASCALAQPGCPLFPAINRHLLRRAALDLEVDGPLCHLDRQGRQQWNRKVSDSLGNSLVLWRHLSWAGRKATHQLPPPLLRSVGDA